MHKASERSSYHGGAPLALIALFGILFGCTIDDSSTILTLAGLQIGNDFSQLPNEAA